MGELSDFLMSDKLNSKYQGHSSQKYTHRKQKAQADPGFCAINFILVALAGKIFNTFSQFH